MLTPEERMLLTEKQKQLLTMFEDERLSLREIASKLNIQSNHIYREIGIAKHHLRFLRAKYAKDNK